MRFKLLTFFSLLTLYGGNCFSQNLSLWQKLDSPTSQLINKIFFIDSSIGWAAGDSGIILKTINAGESWEILHGAPDTYTLDLFFLDENYGWVLYWDNIPPLASKILKTTNGGADWDTASCPIETFFHAVCFIDSVTGFLAGSPILKTTNGGVSWYETYAYDIDSLPPDISGLPVLELAFADENNGYASGGFRDLAGVIWHTTDRGETWAAAGLAPDAIFDLHISDPLNVKALAGDPEGFFPIVHAATINGGASWLTNELDSYGLSNALAFRTEYEGWGLTWNKFLVTTDAGEVWQEYYTPDSVSFLDITFTDSLTGYAAGSGGNIFKYKVPVLTHVDPDINNLPGIFSLSQNYPNPFNPSTNIRFTLPYSTKVEIRIYDVLGREIKELMNEEKSAGTHELTWMPDHIPSGIYFYKIQAGEYSSVKKMTVVR